MSQIVSIRARDTAVKRSGELGFALLEILVAFVILALGLGAVLTGVAVAMRSDARTQSNRVALRLAQSRLEAVGITQPLVPGLSEGQITEKYKWRQTITAIRLKADQQEVQGGKPGQSANGEMKSFWVEVTVQAADGTAAKLAVLKLARDAKQ
jgi:type II secretory pathway pseudopilin PulG